MLGFFSSWTDDGVGAGSMSLTFGWADIGGGGLELAAFAEGAAELTEASPGGDCFLGGERSSVGPERMLAKDIGSAARVGLASFG